MKQEAFEKCWAHSPLRADARPNVTLPFTRCRYCRTPPAHRCPRRWRRQQRQRVTEGTAMAPWNGPNELQCLSVVLSSSFLGSGVSCCWFCAYCLGRVTLISGVCVCVCVCVGAVPVRRYRRRGRSAAGRRVLPLHHVPCVCPWPVLRLGRHLACLSALPRRRPVYETALLL